MVIILLAGFLFLVKGADWFVEGAASIAKKLGIPQLIIGLTIVAMGTSMPEAAVSITAAINKNAGITIGNVVGSNILNIFIILGITAVITNVAIQKIHASLRNSVYDSDNNYFADLWYHRFRGDFY